VSHAHGNGAHNVGDDQDEQPGGPLPPARIAGAHPHPELDPLVGSTADPVLLSHPPEPEPVPGGRAERRRPIRDALSSPTALAITVLVAACGLMLAFYVAVAQINLTNCLADYNEAASQATAARADASAQDRSLDLQARAIDTADRLLDRGDAAAFDTALAAIDTPGQDEAFAALRRQRAATSRQRMLNDTRRAQLAVQRADIERSRAAHPLPAPPSQRCG
jgi:hypothetical protein